MLGVAPGASAAAIRAAYRRRARALHPDTGHGSEAEMATLNAAWSVLRDPRQRAAYDAGRTDHTPRSATHEPRTVADEVHIADPVATPHTLRAERRLRTLVAVAVAMCVAVLVLTVVLGFTQGPGG